MTALAFMSGVVVLAFLMGFAFGGYVLHSWWCKRDLERVARHELDKAKRAQPTKRTVDMAATCRVAKRRGTH